MEEVKLDDEQITETAHKPRPYLTWEVNGEEYHLKLTASVISKLEEQLDAPLMDAILSDGMPKLTVVIAVLQGAMLKYHHGMKAQQVAEVLDAYFDEGKTQLDLLKEVIYPLMYDVGFFTETMYKTQLKAVDEMDMAL